MPNAPGIQPLQLIQLLNDTGIYKESVELTSVYLIEGCGKTLAKKNDTIPHTRIDMGYWDAECTQPQVSIRK